MKYRKPGKIDIEISTPGFGTMGLRNKIKLADNMPCWLIASPKDFDTYLNDTLLKLQSVCRNTFNRILSVGFMHQIV